METRNHRTFEVTEPIDGSRRGKGLIIADLYRPDGTFYRTAVVADCRTEEGAKQWLARNAECTNPQHD